MILVGCVGMSKVVLEWLEKGGLGIYDFYILTCGLYNSKFMEDCVPFSN